MSETQNVLLDRGLEQLGLTLEPIQKQQLLDYVAMLQKWNKTYNLTALRDKETMLSHHVLDSLTLVPMLGDAKSLIDVGSGGGMPGIPVAIARPEVKVTLLDANSKKTTFLQQAVIELNLSNVDVLTGRVEAVHGQSADILTSRAFSELNDFVRITKQLLRSDGVWLAMKGFYPYEEITQLPEDVVVSDVVNVKVPFLDVQRHIVRMSLKGSE